MYNEQGGEGLHTEFNTIGEQFCRIVTNKKLTVDDGCSRVLSTLKEHHLLVHPDVRKRRKVNECRRGWKKPKNI